MGSMEFLVYGATPMIHLQRGVLTADLGEESRIDASFMFPDARKALRGHDAVKLGTEMLKGPILYLEDQVQAFLGDAKPDSALFKLTGELRAALNNATIKTEGTTVKLAVRAKTEAATVKAVVDEAAPRIQAAAGRAKARTNLWQIGIAIINYADQNDGNMPPEVVYSKDGKPLYSWRVAILPQLDREDIYRKLKLDEPWDSAHNKPILDKMPSMFELPGIKTDAGMTYFQIFKGAGSFSTKNERARFPASFRDGPSQTILVVEAAEPVHWAAPKDIEYSDKVSPLKQVGKHYGKGTLAAMGDGSVRFIPDGVVEKDFRAAITPAANDVPGRSVFDPFDEDEYRRFDKGGYKDKGEYKGKDKSEYPAKEKRPIDKPIDKVLDRPLEKPLYKEKVVDK
jgi:hypothetical protein